MTDLLLEKEEVEEVRLAHDAERPLTFERFLPRAEGRYVELLDGVIVEKPRVQLDHERCSRWLYQVVGMVVRKRQLGEMLSSRIMVKADHFGGRMPDLLFVRQERADIIQQKAVYGAPDLIIEIVSPHDRPSDLSALEADYHRLGVPELVFINLRKQEIRQLHRRETDYEEKVLTSGPVTFETMDGPTLQAEWIL